jgi:hypothetical protein
MKSVDLLHDHSYDPLSTALRRTFSQCSNLTYLDLTKVFDSSLFWPFTCQLFTAGQIYTSSSWSLTSSHRSSIGTSLIHPITILSMTWLPYLSQTTPIPIPTRRTPLSPTTLRDPFDAEESVHVADYNFRKFISHRFQIALISIPSFSPSSNL